MEDRFPRVSQPQIDLWLADPVTQAVMTAITEYEADVREKVGKGQYRIPSNNDLTCNNESHALGMADAYKNMRNAPKMLQFLELVEVEDVAA